jgi:hypothetical protein
MNTSWQIGGVLSPIAFAFLLQQLLPGRRHFTEPRCYILEAQCAGILCIPNKLWQWTNRPVAPSDDPGVWSIAILFLASQTIQWHPKINAVDRLSFDEIYHLGSRAKAFLGDSCGIVF